MPDDLSMPGPDSILTEYLDGFLVGKWHGDPSALRACDPELIDDVSIWIAEFRIVDATVEGDTAVVTVATTVLAIDSAFLELDAGLEDVQQGRVLSHEEAVARIRPKR